MLVHLRSPMAGLDDESKVAVKRLLTSLAERTAVSFGFLSFLKLVKELTLTRAEGGASRQSRSLPSGLLAGRDWPRLPAALQHRSCSQQVNWSPRAAAVQCNLGQHSRKRTCVAPGPNAQMLDSFQRGLLTTHSPCATVPQASWDKNSPELSGVALRWRRHPLGAMGHNALYRSTYSRR